MKKQCTVTAKTVEEAVARAVSELGAPSAEAVSYTVLEEPKKGFLGLGAAPARIEAVYETSGADAALELIRRIAGGMDLGASIEMTRGEEGSTIAVTGGKASALIGHHGETLDALQYLANLAANKRVEGEKRDYCRVTVDVENYRAKREETLRALARRTAEKVLKYGRSIMLEPMNPYERRIIHSEVQDIEGVSTNSVGSENNRKVVIYPEDAEDAGRPAGAPRPAPRADDENEF